MTAAGLVPAVVTPAARTPMPAWVGYASAGLVVVVALVGVWLTIRATGDWGFGQDGGADQGGNGGGGRPRPPQGPPPKSDPDWWPEFERAFAAYVRGRLPRVEREVGPSRAGPREVGPSRAGPPEV